MRIVFNEIDTPIHVCTDFVSTIEIQNQKVFSRMCDSLVCGNGVETNFPYTLWTDEGSEIKAKDALIVITSPLCLPWSHKHLEGKLFEKIERELNVFDDTKRQAETLHYELTNLTSNMCLQMNADYHFGLEWDIRKYLKAFSFSVDTDFCDTFLDKLIMFIDFASDMALERPLVFINLKKYLSKNDLRAVLDHFLLRKIAVLLIESGLDDLQHAGEEKITVEQGFLESFKSNNQSNILSFCNGEFAPTVLVQ